MYLGNNLYTTLSGTHDDSTTTINVSSGDGADFGTEISRIYGSEKFPYYLTIFSSDYASPTLDESREIVAVSARTDDAFTVTRGQRGTSASAHSSGDKVIMGNYADDVATYHGVGCNAYLGTAMTNITNNTLTNVLLDTETYDLDGGFSTSAWRYVPPVDGYYLCYGQIYWSGITATQEYETFLRKNGTITIAYGKGHSSTTDTLVTNAFTIVPLVGGTDYVRLVARHQAGVNTPDIVATYTYMVIHLLYRT